LCHLAAVLPQGAPVSFWDDAPAGEPSQIDPERLVVYGGQSLHPQSPLAVFPLSFWEDDEAIEYLLAVHKDHCASVMARLHTAPDKDLLNGTPELWRIVVDQMAVDGSIREIRTAFESYFNTRAPDPQLQHLIRAFALATIAGPAEMKAEVMTALRDRGCPEEVIRTLRHETVRVLLASQQIAADLHSGASCDYLAVRLPLNVVRMAGAAVGSDPASLAFLHNLLTDVPWKQAMAASILLATHTGWKPVPWRTPLLSEAYLHGAEWAGVDLTSATLSSADLSSANLERAVLDRATAFKANLFRTNLHGASLQSLQASEALLRYANLSHVQADRARFDFADLTGANLEKASLKGCEFQGANLTRANFHKADLTQASIMVAQLREADFSGANLEKATLAGTKLREADFTAARFPGANLTGCDLEDMQLPNTDFTDANLTNALLTGSTMPGADFSRARLGNTGLADVNWEGAILREADLRGATFHMGSSRSGLVFSPFASEGSRTGFYTDDYEEQNFKCPEEIRKANLRGADLRGANIDDVDFYLVDLREAVYSAEQERHFQRCGAILGGRA
jgi:uncharacterized protein YjbI with pentapeptide repeats